MKIGDPEYNAGLRKFRAKAGGVPTDQGRFVAQSWSIEREAEYQAKLRAEGVVLEPRAEPTKHGGNF